MNNKKKIVIVLSLVLGSTTLPSVAETQIVNSHNISVSELKNHCLPFDLNKVEYAINEKKQICFKNPFDEAFNVPFSFKRKDEQLLDLSDFDNQINVYKKYIDFVNSELGLNSEELLVSQIYLSNNKVYKFLKFTDDGSMVANMTRKLTHTKFNGDERMYMLFHEIMHLSNNHNYYTNPNVEQNNTEAAADIGASLLLTLKNGLDLDTTLSYIKQIESIRMEMPKNIDNKAKAMRMRNIHYSREGFSNVKKNIKTEEFKKTFNYLKTLDFSNVEDFKKILLIVDELSFNSQQLNENDFVAFMKSDRKL